MNYVYDQERIDDLAAKYRNMTITRQMQEIESEAKAILVFKHIYRRAEVATAVPWPMIGVIDLREGGVRHLCTRHLHNGDPLTDYTKNVPSGRPRVGHGPPFTWMESAIDALKLEGLTSIWPWTIERVLHQMEPYNGLGYFNGPTDIHGIKHPSMPSPYIWSCTDIYDPPNGPGGKYIADHRFDPTVIDQQIGCAPILRVIARIDPDAVIPSANGDA